jgi:FkbM family methyltransferase
VPDSRHGFAQALTVRTGWPLDVSGPEWFLRMTSARESLMIGPIAYDVGMNNGDDSDYYLKKGYNVVGIDANPIVCEQAARRFDVGIKAGRITILNLGVGSQPGRMTFYVHKGHSVLSTFCPEQILSGDKNDLNPEVWQPIDVEVRRLSDIVRFFGTGEYIKIDVEGFDVVALKDLNVNKIYPKYISAEAHQVDTFCHLVAMGYTEFKFVQGATVHTLFSDHEIGFRGAVRGGHSWSLARQEDDPCVMAAAWRGMV